MDYATLTGSKATEGSIRSWANHGLAPAGTILEEAQAFLYQTLRVREMRSDTVSLAVKQGVIAVALPADFLDPIGMWDQYQHPLDFKNERDIEKWRCKDDNGDWLQGACPTRYAIYGEKFQFDLPPSADIQLSYVYFQRPALLSDDNPTNFLTRRYPQLLRKACLIGIYDYLKRRQDKAEAVQETISLISSISSMDDLSRRGENADADYARYN